MTGLHFRLLALGVGLGKYVGLGRRRIGSEKRPSHQQSCKLPGNGVRGPEADFGGIRRLHFNE
jgi:hypothetical protein